MPEVDLDFPRAFVEFVNPDDAEEIFKIDLTWLTSNYNCIFGSGCHGIYKDSPDVGCCTLGAHFADKDDEKRVKEYVKRLTPEQWQLHPANEYDKKGNLVQRHTKKSKIKVTADAWVEKDEEGERKTKATKFKGQRACTLFNRPGFEGGYGCALHILAMSDGVDPLTYKPEVCWQLPIRRTFRTVERQDDTSYLEITISEYDRRGWGPGGHDLDWYCTGNPEAHNAPKPLYITSKNELVELMGEKAYAELVVHCEDHLRMRRKLAVHPADIKVAVPVVE